MRDVVRSCVFRYNLLDIKLILNEVMGGYIANDKSSYLDRRIYCVINSTIFSLQKAYKKKFKRYEQCGYEDHESLVSIKARAKMLNPAAFIEAITAMNGFDIVQLLINLYGVRKYFYRYKLKKLIKHGRS